MRTQTFISSMVGVAAAVAVAGSANAAIVWSGVQNGSISLTAGVSSLVMTSNGSFQSDPEYDPVTSDPLFVAFGNFITGNYTVSSTSYSQIGLMGASDDGSNGSFRFQVYGNLATNSSSGLRTVVNNTFGTSINGLSGTLAYLGASAGSGFALGNPNSYNFYRLNGGSTGAQGGQFNNSTGYVGFRFTTDAGTSWFYGWAKYSGAANGASGTLVEWAYNDTAGGAITAGQVPVPAPGALALLGVAGLVGARRRRA